MLRTALAVLSGLIVGAAGSVSLGPKMFRQHSPSTISVTETSRGPRLSTPQIDGELVLQQLHEGAANRRATIYQIAVRSDAPTLSKIIDELASGDSVASNRFALSVLFSRYAELDAAGSIQALRLLRDARLAEAMALEILEVIGIDEFNVTWVAGSLPDSDPMIFRVDAIAKLADTAPNEALQLALLTDSRAHRSHAVRRVARTWARQDPAAALAAAEQLNDNLLRNTMRSVAGQEWARAQPETLLEHLAGISSRREFVALGRTGALMELANSYPQRLLALAEDLPTDFANDIKVQALYRWSESEPLEAWAYAATLPPGERRRQAEQQIARVYGRSDPDAALLWLEGISDPRQELLNYMLQGIAETDPERALTVAFASDANMQQPWVLQNIVFRIGTTDPERMPQIAEAALALDADKREPALNMLAQTWARTDPEGALDWALTRTDVVPDSALAQIADRLAQQDPARAAAYVSRVPPETRDRWIRAVAGGYARYDMPGALEWVGQYRGQDAYVPAMLSVISATAERDPVTAADLLTSLGTLPDRSRGTVEGIVRRWVAQDAPAARRYTLGLPNGDIRDSALASLIAANNSSTLPDAELMRSFSSDLAREQAVSRIIYNIARDDPEEARRMIDEHLSFPAIRSQAERYIEQVRR